MARRRNCPCCDCIEDGCCDECTECSACTTVDWHILITDVNQAASLGMSRSVLPCVAACSTCGKVAPNACVKIRIENQTDQAIEVPFSFTVAGLVGSCKLYGLYNCEAPDEYANGAAQPWFAVSLEPGQVADVTMDHYVGGTGCCEEGPATISGFSYQSAPVVVEPQGYCCDALPGVGDNPGCDPSLEVTGQGSCVDDADCEAQFPVGSCQETICPSCPSGTAWYLVTGYSSPPCFFGTCGWLGDFSCCT